MFKSIKNSKVRGYLIASIQMLGLVVAISNAWWAIQNEWSASFVYLMFVSTIMMMAPVIAASNKPQRRAYAAFVIGATVMWIGYIDDALLVFIAAGFGMMVHSGYQLFKFSHHEDKP